MFHNDRMDWATNSTIWTRSRRTPKLTKLLRNQIAVFITASSTLLASSPVAPYDETRNQLHSHPTPDRSQVQVIDRETPTSLTDPDAISAYHHGYSNMRDAAWFSATTAYYEAIRIRPEVGVLHVTRGTAYMYAGRHAEVLADYTRKLNSNQKTQRIGAGERTGTPSHPLTVPSKELGMPPAP